MKETSERHVVFVQFGDFAEAVDRFAAGGAENYFAQKYTVEYVEELARTVGKVTVVTFSVEYPLRVLPSGVSAAGICLYEDGNPPRHEALIRLLAQLNPTDIIFFGPLRRQIQWALKRGIRTLPLFADSFRASGLKNWVRGFLISSCLNDRRIPLVANHSLAAAEDLVRIGVRSDKVVAYDWPAVVSPDSYRPRTAPTSKRFKVIYVGMMMESKGVGDLIRAVASVEEADLTLVGAGEESTALAGLAESLGAGSRVTFLGKVPHSRVLELLVASDAAVVPSRHEYPEGIPMTIYEALCTGAPLIASDHPMFSRRLTDGENCLIFREKDDGGLARQLRRLISDPALYEALSKAALKSASTYLGSLKWHEVVGAWLAGGKEISRILGLHSLKAGQASAAARI